MSRIMNDRTLLILGILCWSSQAIAQSVWSTPQQARKDVEQFTHHRIGDVRRLVLGPYQPQIAPVPPAQSCRDLYAQRLPLMQAQNDYRPGFTDDPRNRAAIFIGTIFTPAFYYLAFTGVQAYGDATNKAETQSELDALRYASAEQQCYVHDYVR